MKLITKIVGATLGLAMAIGVSVGVVSNRKAATRLDAADTPYYTFQTAQSSSNTAYASNYNVTINGIQWSVPGNQNFSGYVRLGGKKSGDNALDADRVITGKGAIDKAIEKITVSHNGVSNTNLVVKSIKLEVSSAANFNSIFDTVTFSVDEDNMPSISKSTAGTFDFTPTSGNSWATNSYYRVTFHVYNDMTTNYGFDLKKMDFYKDSAAPAKTVTGISIDTAPSQTEYYSGESFDPSGLVITVSYDVGEPENVAYDEHPNNFSWTPETIISEGNVSIQYDDYSSFKVNQPVTLVTPMTVPQAITAIEAAEGNQIQCGYVSGLISQIGSYSSKYHSITYWISEDGTTTNQLEVYGGKGMYGADFSSVDDLSLGDQVVVKGTLKKYNAVYEFDSNSQLVYKVASPRVYSIDLTPTDITLEPNATGDIADLFTDITINQNDVSHKTIDDIEWSSDDDDIVLVGGDEYLVTGNHRESTTIRASIDGNEFANATVTIIDPSVYVMSYDTSVWTLVANPSTLVAGDKVILTGVKDGATYAAGTFVSGGNNVQADTTHTLAKLGDQVRGVVDTMVYTLETGSVNGSLAFKDSAGKYLYAASSSSNYMKAQDEIDENSSWILNSTGTVVAQGTNTRNYMRYNNTSTSNLFSCYGSSSTTGDLVTFYKYNGGQQGKFDLPSLSAVKSVCDDGNETYVRLGINLSADDGNTIDSEFGISGYGGMLIRKATLDSKGFDSIEEAYYADQSADKPNFKNLTKASDVAPTDGSIVAKINITNNANKEVIFCAATYVISENGTYCFINEVRDSFTNLN